MRADLLRCSHCRLTLAALAWLAGVVSDLRRSRPGDPEWGFDICPNCGEVTAVYDQREDWVLGNRDAVIPVAPAPPVPLHRPFVSVT